MMGCEEEKLWKMSYRNKKVVSCCPVCLGAKDSVEHLFRECPVTVQVLQELNVPFSSSNNENNWKHCIYHEGVNRNVKGIIVFVKTYMHELESLESVLPQFQQAHNITWELSVGDTMKVNFDTTFHQSIKKATTGILVRNNEGLVIVVCTYPYENVADSTAVKARACLRAVIFMEELRFQEVVVKGDVLAIIKKLRALEEDK
ncbi:hypothetical protein Gogos_020073 [Gossypium gossypioides]|uniref:RNase H type-1 domain-containing protein n=1 Tax=Gossypium gossypioides TaxID=34282 RepID=A0A7J9D0U1_GOSGO|nr:hypothetical protein [Gossypium gossypioides]